MRTGDTVDLVRERRLSAVLGFADHGAELLVLNGGARAEEITIETIVTASQPRIRRAFYCVDAGTSMQLVFPLLEDENVADFSVRIVGGPEDLVLSPDVKRRSLRVVPTIRGTAAAAAVAIFLFVAGGRLDPAALLSTVSVEPVTEPLVPTLMRPAVALGTLDRLPNVLRSARIAHTVPMRPRTTPNSQAALRSSRRTTGRSERRLASAVPGAPRFAEPRITDLRVPMTAKSGESVPVAYHAVASKVKIVATIGPTVVARKTVDSSGGVLALHPPKSNRDGRVMTVRAYAQNGDRTSIVQAMVVLIRP